MHTFVHLRLHTEFSVVDSTVRIAQALQAAQEDAQVALAITDLSNLFGAVKFYKAALAQGIKPIIGAELLVQGLGTTGSTAATPGAPADKPAKVLLLVTNAQGYSNLCKLLSLAWTQSAAQGMAAVSAQSLAQYASGLIALSGSQGDALGQALLQRDTQRASAIAQQLARMFERRFYIELQRVGRADETTFVSTAVQLACTLQLPVVATQPIQFMQEQDHEAHEVRVCIAEGQVLGNTQRARHFTAEQYFKSQAQMCALFADVPSALANTIEIARRCSFLMHLGDPLLPNYPTPLRHGVPLPLETHFCEASYAGLEERLVALFADTQTRDLKRPQYQARLAYEIETIVRMQFPGYFLIVADIVNWAKNNGCPVGPGRGSGAGSLVAYALGITDLDPLAYSLLFERFLNPERVSLPDFDIDFCQLNRDRVIDYVRNRYGSETVSQIATFGTMAARAVIRDVGRVLDLSYNYCDGISKLIPVKSRDTKITLMTLSQALIEEPMLASRLAQEEDLQLLMETAQKLEGLTRNVGMHAGGVLIAPGKLTEVCPLYMQPGGAAAMSQFDKDDVEAIGLVKFDFLGLATLTILEVARTLVRARHEKARTFNYETLPLDDPAVYALFTQANTQAVFQFESSGMRTTLREAKPSRMEDLIALNALFRPGPMDNIPSFVARKHGREAIEYPHPLTEELLSETYGIMVYQEQVMQTAQVLAGYSLGEADLLRRAMGKKKPEEMARQREIFRAGCAKNTIAPQQADELFDLIEKFSGYGFNKSHSVAYARLAYYTAWLKVHYTVEFYCANMTVEMGNTDKLLELVEDATANAMAFDPPDINRSGHDFFPVDDRTLRYGLGAIKGTGRAAVEAMMEARAQGGAFHSLFDFVVRVDKTRVNKRALEALIRAGAFDSLHPNRAAVLASVDLALGFAAAKSRNANQRGLFDTEGLHGCAADAPALVHTPAWSLHALLMEEKTALGFFLTAHLFDVYAAEARQMVKSELHQLRASSEPQLLCGIVRNLRTVALRKTGQRLTIFTLDDRSAQVEATVDASQLVFCKGMLAEEAFVIVRAHARHNKRHADGQAGALQLKVSQLWDLPAARCRFARHLRIPAAAFSPEAVRQLCAAHPPRPYLSAQGSFTLGLSVCVEHKVPAPREAHAHVQQNPEEIIAGAHALVDLGEKAWFFPTDDALAFCHAQFGAEHVQLVY